jgi:prevent-host-death family protein
MSEIINLYEAKTNLSSLVERAAGGEEIVIAKGGRPMARLVPLRRDGLLPQATRPL